MEDSMKDRLTSGDLWLRLLFMILFAIAYGVAELLVTLTAIFQFLTILFTGGANEPLLRFGKNLSTYIRQIISFETFNTEERPWPMADWPDEAVGENRWMSPPSDPTPPPPPAPEPESVEAPAPDESSTASSEVDETEDSATDTDEPNTDAAPDSESDSDTPPKT